VSPPSPGLRRTGRHVVAAADRAALRDLELLARTTVEGLRQGLHRSPFHGFSAEFSQYRHYRPGDDLKYVDWKAFARTDRLYSRQFRETTNLGALFVVDVSGSMAFGTKLTLAAAVAAALGTLVIDQGDAAGLLALDSDARAEYVPARSGRHHLRVFLAALARLRPAGPASVAETLRRAATLLRRRGMIVVLSDLYDETATLGEVRRLSRMGHDVIIIQTLSPDEMTLPRTGAAEFEDLETGARIVADARAVRDDYTRAIATFLSTIEKTMQREGLDYVKLLTGEPIEPPLRRLLLSRRGGQ
jgi:uncharacterized protein (DUF58 family)